jgi:hypothetical protein
MTPPALRLLCTACVLLPALCAHAQTSTFRCGNALVQLGEAKAAVLGKCGAPVLKDSFCKPLPRRPAHGDAAASAAIIGSPCETVEEWTFNPGYGKFMTLLRFDAGRLAAISYGERVK